MNDRQFEETADAAPAAAPAVGHEETAAVAAVADSDMPGDLPDIAWSEVELAECEAMYWRKPAGEREDVLTLIRALRVARTSLAEALDAYRSGRDAMQAECDRLEAECQELADKGDGANLRHAQLWARCERAERERDEARAAGRETVAENAALRRENERLRGDLFYIERCTVDVLNEISGVITENARGGPLERGKAGGSAG